MSRIRSIHPGLASDEAFMSMTIAAKAAWPILWTECDDHGVFEWKPIVLKARIFPADNIDFADLLAEYERLGCIKRVEREGKSFGLVRNFCRYQRPKNPSYRFPFSPGDEAYVALKREDGGTPTPALPQPTPSPTEKSPQMKEEGGNRRVEEGNNSKQGLNLDSEFGVPSALVANAIKGALRKPEKSQYLFLKTDDTRVDKARRWWLANYGSPDIPPASRGRRQGYNVPWEAVR